MNDLKTLSAILLLGVIAGCGPATEESCAPDGELRFVCGPRNAEDLVRVPGTAWILSGGMASGAGFYSIDSTSGSWDGLDFAVGHDAARFPSCPVAPVRSELEIHGLNIRQSADNRRTLYAVAHGGREAIEVFDVDSDDGAPSLTWVGCVEMPNGLPANSVASAPDGSLYATVLLMPGKTFADSIAMRPTGAVFRWTPGDDVFTMLEGSELPGNNGIEVSADGSELFVVSSGFQTIVAFSNSNPVRRIRSTAQLPMTPDNVHMAPNGMLLTAGMKNDVPECGGPPGPQHDLATLAACPRGAIAIEIDPQTMSHRIIAETPANPLFSNATMVLTIGDRFWLGTFSGDRVLYGPLR